LREQVGLLSQFAPGLDGPFMAALAEPKTLDEARPLLEDTVRGWCRRDGSNDTLVLAVASAIMLSKGSARIADLTGRSGISERQLQRRFREEVGLTPKQFARVVRLRAAAVDVAMRGAGTWGEVAAERGFSDQAHLVREFAQIFGMTPTEFRDTFAPAIEHVDIQP
jgi:AraC-like DNA-binding protein